MERIPDSGEMVAREVLSQCAAVVDRKFIESLGSHTRVALGQFGMRGATVALRAHDGSLLRDALFATALASTIGMDDVRDMMVALAVHYDVARRIGFGAAELFQNVADRFAGTEAATLLRNFGSRTDITLAAFGWKLVETAGGLDYEPA